MHWDVLQVNQLQKGGITGRTEATGRGVQYALQEFLDTKGM